jgi:hypothetical protein
VSGRSTLGLLIVGVSLVFGLAACGGGDAAGTSTSASSSQGGSSTSSAALGSDVTAPPARARGSEGSPSSNGGGAAGNEGSAGPDEGANRSTPSSSLAEGGGGGEGHATGAAAFIAPSGDNSIPEYGSEASSTERAEATASLRVYLSARANGDWSGACARMAAPVRQQAEALAKASKPTVTGCESAYTVLSKYASAEELDDPFLGALAAFRVKGDKAFALFYGPRDQQYMMPMVSEDGAWKVNQIAPVAYPPGAMPKGSP